MEKQTPTIPNKRLNHQKGSLGEKKARRYLFWHGYRIIYTNYTCPIGEIDIVAYKDGFLVVVEVKYRKDDKFGAPAEAVTAYKQNKIVKTTQYFLVENKLTGYQIRFDCIEILGKKINHIVNAFGV